MRELTVLPRGCKILRAQTSFSLHLHSTAPLQGKSLAPAISPTQTEPERAPRKGPGTVSPLLNKLQKQDDAYWTSSNTCDFSSLLVFTIILPYSRRLLLATQTFVVTWKVTVSFLLFTSFPPAGGGVFFFEQKHFIKKKKAFQCNAWDVGQDCYTLLWLCG